MVSISLMCDLRVNGEKAHKIKKDSIKKIEPEWKKKKEEIYIETGYLSLMGILRERSPGLLLMVLMRLQCSASAHIYSHSFCRQATVSQSLQEMTVLTSRLTPLPVMWRCRLTNSAHKGLVNNANNYNVPLVALQVFFMRSSFEQKTERWPS